MTKTKEKTVYQLPMPLNAEIKHHLKSETENVRIGIDVGKCACVWRNVKIYFVGA